MKEVNIYVRGVCRNTGEYSELKEGAWVAVLEYNNRFKMIRGNEANTADGRMITIGILEAIKLLKESCNINIYTHTLFFKRIKKDRKQDRYEFRAFGTHKKLLEELELIINEKGHKLNIFIGTKNQEELKKYIKYEN